MLGLAQGQKYVLGLAQAQGQGPGDITMRKAPITRASARPGAGSGARHTRASASQAVLQVVRAKRLIESATAEQWFGSNSSTSSGGRSGSG